jgi:2-keto-4-pentenoate hydratase/2-oxohepta-3-ene-1,7-dioic acid hydratase in catechol pathway
MRLAAFTAGGRDAIGVVRDAAVVDLSADPSLPHTIEELLERGADALARAHAVAETGEAIPLERVRLRAPVTSPRKFLAIAANYQSHIDEVLATNPNYVPPTDQRWFNKQVTSINGPYDAILMPPESNELDYEAELAIIIGRRCRRVPLEAAPSVIGGFTVCNDVSARDWQRRSPTIMLGKSFDTHGPLGPWLVTPDELGDPHDLEITCTVNGELRQRGSTAEMINNCYEQIVYLSTVFTLEPGDVLATGTPAGTGLARKPPRLLRAGDIVRCEIERIGAIQAVIEPESVSTQPWT